jgi:1,4-dihydroxy-6-naphthoate synthase
VPGVRTEEMQFDKVLELVKTGHVEAGLLIHEGQITYEKEGLYLVCDFGEWWKSETGLPLPLGANIIKRSLGDEIISKCGEGIRKSVRYGLEHRTEAIKYAQDYGRNLVQNEIDEFVSMYVNDFTVDLGEDGKRAAIELLRRGAEAGIVPELDTIDFAG